MTPRIFLAAALLCWSSFSFAQGTAAPAAEPESPWEGAVSLGYLSTSGNTETTTYNTKFAVSHERDKWKHTFDGAGNGAEDTDVATAEAYSLGWKSDYSFNERNYLYGLLAWNKDRFSGVTEQSRAALGYGRRIFDTPSHTLNLEIGAGYRDADLSDGTTESGSILQGALDYTWIFSETSGFDQDINVESGSDNTYIESVSALRANLLGDFGLVLSYTIRHNTDVPAGNEKTDKLTAISLEYAF